MSFMGYIASNTLIEGIIDTELIFYETIYHALKHSTEDDNKIFSVSGASLYIDSDENILKGTGVKIFYPVSREAAKNSYKLKTITCNNGNTYTFNKRCDLVSSYSTKTYDKLTYDEETCEIICVTKKEKAHAYYKDGLLDRDFLPAVEFDNGCKIWYKKGQIYRNLGYPAVIFKDLNAWFENGKLHNSKAPAIITDTFTAWFYEGIIHRIDVNKPCIECISGLKVWYKDGKKHRDGYPAVESLTKKEWYKDGKLNRSYDQPTIVYNNGIQLWHKDGLLHRDNGPAMIVPNEEERWYKFGKLHRDDDQPAIETTDGIKMWYCNGVLHRDEYRGPAEINSKGKYYYKDGKLHRSNRWPAVIYANDEMEYWVNGIRINN